MGAPSTTTSHPGRRGWLVPLFRSSALLRRRGRASSWRSRCRTSMTDGRAKGPGQRVQTQQREDHELGRDSCCAGKSFLNPDRRPRAASSVASRRTASHGGGHWPGVISVQATVMETLKRILSKSKLKVVWKSDCFSQHTRPPSSHRYTRISPHRLPSRAPSPTSRPPLAHFSLTSRFSLLVPSLLQQEFGDLLRTVTVLGSERR